MFAAVAAHIPRHRDTFFTEPPNPGPSLVRRSAFIWQADGVFPTAKATPVVPHKISRSGT